jgi:DNA-binding GntR family transcriptional regulator
LSQISLSQQAYEDIKQKIVSLELPPGSVIDEGSLQDELGLGRTPIREALKRLSLEKLVNIVPRRGMFVTEIGITDLQQLFELRVILESLAARFAAQRGNHEQWHRMDSALNGLSWSDSPTEDETLMVNEALIAIDRACHEIVYEAANNEFLQDTLITHYALSLRLWYFFLADIGDMRQVISEHKRILEALKARDADRASQLMEFHIQAFQEEIQSVMMGVPA